MRYSGFTGFKGFDLQPIALTGYVCELAALITERTGSPGLLGLLASISSYRGGVYMYIYYILYLHTVGCYTHKIKNQTRKPLKPVDRGKSMT